jgi:release factor glutamine methyltransferase
MRLREWLANSAAQLSAGPHPERARQDAETLLLHVIGKNKAWLMAHADDDFAGCTAIRYAGLLERRRKGEPIQYITGETEFYGMPFRVTPDVLIPRPETEHLVEKVLALARHPGARSIGRSLPDGWETTEFVQLFPAEPKTLGAPGLASETWESSAPARPVRILDVATGSGAISVALASHLQNANLTATDISDSALAVARENANRNRVSIRFLQGDLLTPVAGETFDLIVSNPPYVPSSDRDSLSVEVRDHEPSLALFAGDGGLEIYRRLIPQAFAALASCGYIALEIGYNQQPAVHALLADAGFSNIEFTPDLQSIPRVAIAQRR